MINTLNSTFISPFQKGHQNNEKYKHTRKHIYIGQIRFAQILNYRGTEVSFYIKNKETDTNSRSIEMQKLHE